MQEEWMSALSAVMLKQRLLLGKGGCSRWWPSCSPERRALLTRGNIEGTEPWHWETSGPFILCAPNQAVCETVASALWTYRLPSWFKLFNWIFCYWKRYVCYTGVYVWNLSEKLTALVSIPEEVIPPKHTSWEKLKERDKLFYLERHWEGKNSRCLLRRVW